MSYLATEQLPQHWSAQDKRKFLFEICKHVLDGPYLFKICPDQIIRRCVPDVDQRDIIAFCHSEACGGHFSAKKTAAKILQSNFCWPTLFKDSFSFFRSCSQCQQLGAISKRDMMPLTPILAIEIFDCWGVGLNGTLPKFEWLFVHSRRCLLCLQVGGGDSNPNEYS